MTKNVGRRERVIRLILGIAIFVTGLLYNSCWGLIGLIPIITASIGFCPLWSALGISTVKKTEINN